MSRGGEKLLGVDHPMQHADHLVAEAVHDRQRDAEDVRLSFVVEVNVFDIELSRAFVIGSLPPRRLPMWEVGPAREGRDEIALNVGDEQ